MIHKLILKTYENLKRVTRITRDQAFLVRLELLKLFCVLVLKPIAQIDEGRGVHG